MDVSRQDNAESIRKRSVSRGGFRFWLIVTISKFYSFSNQILSQSSDKIVEDQTLARKTSALQVPSAQYCDD